MPDGVSIFEFIAMVFLTAMIPNVVFWIVYHKREEYIYFKNILKNRILATIKRKLH